jgi:hypothetical protein
MAPPGLGTHLQKTRTLPLANAVASPASALLATPWVVAIAILIAMGGCGQWQAVAQPQATEGGTLDARSHSLGAAAPAPGHGAGVEDGSLAVLLSKDPTVHHVPDDLVFQPASDRDAPPQHDSNGVPLLMTAPVNLFHVVTNTAYRLPLPMYFGESAAESVSHYCTQHSPKFGWNIAGGCTFCSSCRGRSARFARHGDSYNVLVLASTQRFASAYY